MRAAEAGRDRRRIVGDDHVARPEERRASRGGRDATAGRRRRRAGHGHRPDDGSGVRRRSWLRDIARRSAARGVPRSASHRSRAAAAGRFRSDRSASGSAAACSGVSMSPGSNDIIATPSGASSACQMRVRWSSAALLSAVGAPALVGGHRGIARDVDTKPPRPSRAAAVSEPRTALVSRNGPSRLVASAASRSSQTVSASGASGTGPRLEALFTRTSTPPSAAASWSAIG